MSYDRCGYPLPSGKQCTKMAVRHLENIPWCGGFHQAPDKSAKTPRNNPCPCGSGIKYKKCCFLKNGKSHDSLSVWGT